MKLLENKTSIITGAGSGIGMETVKLFAESGSNIILAGRRLAPLEKIRAEISVQMVHLRTICGFRI